MQVLTEAVASDAWMVGLKSRAKLSSAAMIGKDRERESRESEDVSASVDNHLKLRLHRGRFC